jgi:hypothetical protein
MYELVDLLSLSRMPVVLWMSFEEVKILLLASMGSEKEGKPRYYQIIKFTL